MTIPLRRPRALAALMLCAGLFAPVTAHGQTEDPQRSRAVQALYEPAIAELDAKKFASACPKLEEVTRLLPDAMGVKLTLAECYEGLGKRASAWLQYMLVEAMASKAGDFGRAKLAGKSAAALKPKLATLLIEVPTNVRSIPGLAITRDGLPVSEAQWGTAQPVDVGVHEVVATAPGRKAWKGRADVVKDGANVSVVLEAPEVEPDSNRDTSAPLDTNASPKCAWQRPVGIAAMGLGGAGLVLGSVLGGLAISKKDQSNAEGHCDDADICDPTGIDLRKEAVGLGNGSTAAIIVSAAFLAGGVVLFATAPTAATNEKQERANAKLERPSMSLDLTAGFVRLRGTW